MAIISADTSATAMGMNPGRPDRISGKQHADKGAHHAQEQAVHHDFAPALVLAGDGAHAPANALEAEEHQHDPEMMPSVIVQRWRQTPAGR